MRQFRFYLRGDSDVWLTNVQTLPTTEAACQKAIAVARDLSSTAALSGVAGIIEQNVEVVDETGDTVVVVPVGRATGED